MSETSFIPFSTLMVFGGPNGSGKSTITQKYPIVGFYVNADDIQIHLQCTPLDAARIAENTREHLLSQHQDFTFESVLSTDRNYLLMAKAKENRYRVICVFILTIDPKINVSRVESRVRNGGHYVPPEKIVERYHRSMRLFPKLFDVCDECYVYDNSYERDIGEPSMILKWRYGTLEKLPNKLWTDAMLQQLISGEYLEDNAN